MILIPVTLVPLFMSIVIPPLVACRVTVPITTEAVTVIMATAGQTQEHGHNQRCDHDRGCLQMSHIKLLC
jgi:hypothetical protein